MTKDEFLKEIESVGFTTVGRYPNHFIKDSKGERVFMRILQDRIEYRVSDTIHFCIYYDRIRIEIDRTPGWDTLTISDINSQENYGFFIQLYNNIK